MALEIITLLVQRGNFVRVDVQFPLCNKVSEFRDYFEKFLMFFHRIPLVYCLLGGHKFHLEPIVQIAEFLQLAMTMNYAISIQFVSVGDSG